MDRKRWSDKDDELLKSRYGKVHVEKIAEEMDRTVNAIVCRANALGIRSELRVRKTPKPQPRPNPGRRVVPAALRPAFWEFITFEVIRGSGRKENK